MATVLTTKGMLDEADLIKHEGLVDNDHERTSWTEYWLDGELVHRSVHVTLKEWPEGLAALIGQVG